jgi:hypothetical protein
VKEDEMGRMCSMRGRSAYRVLIGKRERKKVLGRPGRRWKHNRKIDFTGKI